MFLSNTFHGRTNHADWYGTNGAGNSELQTGTQGRAEPFRTHIEAISMIFCGGERSRKYVIGTIKQPYHTLHICRRKSAWVHVPSGESMCHSCSSFISWKKIMISTSGFSGFHRENFRFQRHFRKHWNGRRSSVCSRRCPEISRMRDQITRTGWRRTICECWSYCSAWVFAWERQQLWTWRIIGEKISRSWSMEKGIRNGSCFCPHRLYPRRSGHGWGSAE